MLSKASGLPTKYVIFKVLAVSLAAVGLKRNSTGELYHVIATQSSLPSNKFNTLYGSSGSLHAKAIAAREIKITTPSPTSDHGKHGLMSAKKSLTTLLKSLEALTG
jgi:hypothetical protein